MIIGSPKLGIILTTLLIFIVTMQAAQFKVLLFTETEGYHHQSIAQGVKAMRKLAEKHSFDLTWTENSAIFTEAKLNKYDVVVFLNNDGDVLNSKEQEGLKKYYRSGKGFVGIHGAAATELNWPWFGKLIGRQFTIHPAIQTAEINIIDKNFPATYHLPGKMIWTDEWYEFGPELTDNLNYLITVDEKTYNPKSDWEDKKGSGMRDSHPIAWYQNFDGGRSFYTGVGHIGESFSDPKFLQHIYGGLYWSAMGDK